MVIDPSVSVRLWKSVNPIGPVDAITGLLLIVDLQVERLPLHQNIMEKIYFLPSNYSLLRRVPKRFCRVLEAHSEVSESGSDCQSLILAMQLQTEYT